MNRRCYRSILWDNGYTCIGTDILSGAPSKGDSGSPTIHRATREIIGVHSFGSPNGLLFGFGEVASANQMKCGTTVH